MSKQKIYLFFDEILAEYKKCYKNNYEDIMIQDFKNYYFKFSNNNEFVIITKKNIEYVKNWFLKNNLKCFIKNIFNPISLF